MRVIAEAGNCANSTDWAHKAIDLLPEAVWGFKVQMYRADTLAAKNSPRYDRLAGPATQHDAFTGALPYAAWAEVFDHATKAGFEAFASCWDHESVDAIVDLGAKWIKVGSADITHHDLLTHIAATGLNVILSTGAAEAHEIEEALEIVGDCVLMACTLSYPCAPDDARLSRIRWLERFGMEVGYSDHTTSFWAGAYAPIAGATWLEKHYTITPGEGGDHDFGLNPDDMRTYCEMANLSVGFLGDPEGVLPSEQAARDLARRSLWTTEPIGAGQRIVVGVNAAWLRPAVGGIGANEYGPWVASRDLPAAHQVTREDT